MADHTSIEWTDSTWNPITGCSIVSPGCTNCYAMRLAGTRLKHTPSRAGLTIDSKAGPVWNGQVRLNEQWLDQPLRWKRPRRIFVCAHGDLFAENVPDDWIDKVFAVMALAPQHTFQVLTKRAARMREYLSTRAGDWMIVWPDANPPGSLPISRHGQRLAMQGKGWPDAILRPTFPLSNVWLGVSAEDQTRADERIPELLATPAAIRFVSAEPLLGPIDFRHLRRYNPRGLPWINALRGLVTHGDYLARSPSECSFNIRVQCIPPELPSLDWIIVGGESGKGARPMHPDWVRSIRDQCVNAKTAFFFKQWGSWGKAKPALSETPGRYAIASAGPGSDFWPQNVIEVDYYPRQINLFGGATVREMIGKKKAGRLLDGVEHNAMPQVRL